MLAIAEKSKLSLLLAPNVYTESCTWGIFFVANVRETTAPSPRTSAENTTIAKNIENNRTCMFVNTYSRMHIHKCPLEHIRWCISGDDSLFSLTFCSILSPCLDLPIMQNKAWLAIVILFTKISTRAARLWREKRLYNSVWRVTSSFCRSGCQFFVLAIRQP